MTGHIDIEIVSNEDAFQKRIFELRKKYNF